MGRDETEIEMNYVCEVLVWIPNWFSLKFSNGCPVFFSKTRSAGVLLFHDVASRYTRMHNSTGRQLRPGATTMTDACFCSTRRLGAIDSSAAPARLPIYVTSRTAPRQDEP